MKRALVAGGIGFLGSHLCKRLLDDGYEVECWDNMLTGTHENLSMLKKSSSFTFFLHDIVDPTPGLDFRDRFDVVFNLACPASPPIYQRDPVKTMLTSVVGTYNLLQIAESMGACFFQASTSEIYGDPLEHPQVEQYRGNVNSVGLRACYDEGKRAAETLCFDFCRMRNVDVRVARIFNTYGPSMRADDGRVVSNFINQAIRNEPITVYGDGHQTRSFCYVDDLIDGFVRLVDAKNVFGPVNLGNPKEYRIIDLAAKIIDMTNSKSMIVLSPLPSDDPVLRCPDISLAVSLLGWSPQVVLEAGLRKTIEYFNGFI